MGILDPLTDLEKNVSNGINTAVQDVGNAIGSAEHSAQNAVDQATRATAALAGSGVNAKGQITGPLAESLGADPHQFILNLSRQVKAKAQALVVRVADRTGKATYTFAVPGGGAARSVSARPPSSADPTTIALTLVLAAIDAPATMVEEAGRQANGLPVKPRGLMGFTHYPMSIAGVPRGLFGIDDAALLAIAVPIIIAIASAVLPGLIGAASNVVKAVASGAIKSPGDLIAAITGGQTADQTAAAAAAAAAAADAENKKKTMITIGVIGAIVIFGGAGVYLAMRKKKAA